MSLYIHQLKFNKILICQFFENKNKKINEIDRNMCDSSITEEECYASILTFTNNKSPGSDGFSVEFYKFFWPKIKTYLLNSYKYSFENNLLSIDQRRALITLIPKGNQDKRLLKTGDLFHY